MILYVGSKKKKEKKSELIEKVVRRSDLCLSEAADEGRKNWRKVSGGRKVQPFSYKMNKYQGCDVQHDYS